MRCRRRGAWDATRSQPGSEHRTSAPKSARTHHVQVVTVVDYHRTPDPDGFHHRRCRIEHRPHRPLRNITQLFLTPLFIAFAIYSQLPTNVESSWLVRPILYLLVCLSRSAYPTPAHHRTDSATTFSSPDSESCRLRSQHRLDLYRRFAGCRRLEGSRCDSQYVARNHGPDYLRRRQLARRSCRGYHGRSLGYPVMVLSVCFRGPMFNIRLGVGISVCYIIISHAHSRMNKHSDKDFNFQSYHTEVGYILIVSGATLLVTLVGLFVVVPWNRRVLSNKSRVGFDRAVDVEHDGERGTGGNGVSRSGSRGLNG